jgi:hypothetical protein
VVRWTRHEAVARARSVSIEGARRHFLQKPLTWVGFGAAAVVLAVAGLFGGLEERSDAATVPPVEIGEAVDAGPWRISVERAFTIDELEGEYLTDEEANHFFGLVATVTVIDDRPNQLFARALHLVDVEGLSLDFDGDGLAHPRVLRFDDASPAALNPGVTEQVVYLWEQAKSASVPSEVTIEVLEPNRRRNSLWFTLEWFYEELTPVGAVTVPVEQLPSEVEE